jgi:hypothetical protein
MDIQATKIELIKMIAEIESEKLLRTLQQFLKKEIKAEKSNGKTPSPPSEPEPEWLALARQPMPDYIDLEELKKEQGYSTEKLFEHLRNFDHSLFEDQSLEELLNSLTK